MSESEVTIREVAEVFNPSLPITRGMLDDMTEQRKLLKEFVSSQLRKNVDYGVVPGTKKPCLFKPGGEKIRGLFGLNVTVDCTGNHLDRNGNFAMYTYKAKVFRGEHLIAECEGSTNSQEQKYKERKVWRYDEKLKKKVEIKEATPVCDILNTLQKMAQKRAFVGAVILAVGASDFFTQDIDDIEEARSIGTAPVDTQGASSVPNVTNVSSQPVHNNQNKPSQITIEAIVTYDEKSLAQEAGFRWNKDQKRWTKTISSDEENHYQFETRIV